MVGTIICNHNYAQYIDEAIKSVFSQTVETIPIVIDDASTDNSIEVVKKALEITESGKTRLPSGMEVEYHRGKGLLICLKDNVGPSEARNIGITLTLNFDFYQILDADDIAYPTKVETLLKAMEDKQVGVAYADYDIFNVQTGVTLREYKKPFTIFQLQHECIVHSGSLVRKEALLAVVDENGFYDKFMTTAEDWDLWLRICTKGFTIRHVPESLSWVRTHNQSSVNYRSNEIWQNNWRRIQAKHSR